MNIDSIGGGAAAIRDIAAAQATPARDNPRYEQVVDTLVSPDATQAQRDHAYDLVAGIETTDKICYTDEALTERAAQALADDRTVPVNVSEVAPLVPPGTTLGPFASSDAAAIAMMPTQGAPAVHGLRVRMRAGRREPCGSAPGVATVAG